MAVFENKIILRANFESDTVFNFYARTKTKSAVQSLHDF